MILVNHKGSQSKTSLATEKEQNKAENAGAKILNESQPDEPLKGELELSETEALAENDPAELQEGAPMQYESESGKRAGQAEKAGGKKL